MIKANWLWAAIYVNAVYYFIVDFLKEINLILKLEMIPQAWVNSCTQCPCFGRRIEIIRMDEHDVGITIGYFPRASDEAKIKVW